MAFGKEARITTLLVIDILFFFLELITGYAVGSLALVADSFHMLNDVMSLIVALYAVRLVNKKRDVTDEVEYTYGLQRAEILGALVNGVFLLALCFSIFMEALERLINVTEVQNPQLVVVVGSLGLASNIVGLFLFHDHGHSHGGHSHGHSHAEVAATPSGHDSHGHAHGEHDSHDRAAKSSKAIRTRERSESVSSLIGHPAAARANVVRTAHDMGYDAQSGTVAPAGLTASESSERQRLLAGKANKYGSTHDHAHEHDEDLEEGGAASKKKTKGGLLGRLTGRGDGKSDSHSHSNGGHGHSHGGHSHGGEGSMNMQGVFLHVLGDALGNVGVIASGLFIWFSSASWRFYTDPAISFLITIIIFHSALPLVKSASFILLQGVPNAVPFKAVKESLLEVKGVLSVHELHIWQLSESKNVASVHVLIDVDEAELTIQAKDALSDEASEATATSTTADVHGNGKASADAAPNAASPASRSTLIPQEHRYMDIAAQIRGKLHKFNIHSSTIQPEFVRGGMRGVARANGVEIDEELANANGQLVTTEGEPIERTLSRNGSTACLIACGPDGSCVEASCCPPPAESARSTSPH